jgi:hypothetical protein
MTFTKYVIKIHVGTKNIQPKNCDNDAKIENVKPNDRINGITGKIKILLIVADKDMLPKL